MTPIRPRRSALYMPGSNARAIEKARTLAADAVIFDLEDAVAPDAKAAAREQVCAAVQAGGYGARELVIRINALDTPWGEADLAAADRRGARRDPRAEGVVARDARRRSGLRLRRLGAAGAHPRLGDDRDAARDPASGAIASAAHDVDTRLVLLRHGHERSRQGHPRPPAAGPRGDAALADDARSPPRGPTASTSSTGSTTACPTRRAFAPSASRAAIAASTARR